MNQRNTRQNETSLHCLLINFSEAQASSEPYLYFPPAAFALAMKAQYWIPDRPSEVNCQLKPVIQRLISVT